MKQFKSLRLLRKGKGLFQRLGIDYEQMELILRMKLTMDSRRVPMVFQNSKRKGKKDSNQFTKSLWIYVVYSLAYVPFLFIEDYVFSMSVVFGLFLFLISTTFISDFSTVLLDVRDRNMLHTKPVEAKTISAAKIVHIALYIMFVAGSLIALPLIVGLFVKGIAFTLIFFVQLIFAVMLIVSVTPLFYFLILKIYDGERLKNIINYMQIILSIGIIIGYQLLIRSFQFIDFQVMYTSKWWHVFIPAMWFSGPFELLLNRNIAVEIVMFSILSIIVPVIAVIVYSRLLPQFENNLEKLVSSSIKRKKERSLHTVLAKLVCRSEVEQLYFRMIARQLQDERDFKLKASPAFVFIILFPLLMIFQQVRDVDFQQISEGKSYLYAYLSSLFIPSIIILLKYSSYYKASWIFQVTPYSHERIANSAAIKVLLTKYLAPMYAGLTILFCLLYGMQVLPHMLAIILAAILLALIIYVIISNQSYPLSNSYQFSQEANSAKSLFLGLIGLAFLVIHLLSYLVSWGIYAYVGLLIISLAVFWTILFRTKSLA